MSLHRLHVDIETRSRVDLLKTGVYRYAKCPDFRILMASWTQGGPIATALELDEILDLPIRDSSIVKVAHNAQFERICFSAAYGLPDGKYLPPEEWHDTQAVAAEYGWPQKLETLAKALKVSEKDSAGTRLINLFCKPNRKGGWNGPDTHPMEWLDFIDYCEQDVDTLRQVDEALGEGFPTLEEYDIFMADQHINDRGIFIDVPMARAAEAASNLNHLEQKQRVTDISGVDNPGSVQQMGKWLRDEGIVVPNLRSETVTALLGTDLTDTQREVLELRQELALVASKKYTSALGAVLPDGRLRGTLKFFGAHTGRWAGRGTQVQNLPRSAFKEEVDAELAIWDLMQGERLDAEDLKRLVRPMFTGPFTVVDYAAIEARVLAWLAGEEWALQAFREGRDIYVETAERMGGLSRSEGKDAVLGLGYNGGSNSLRGMAGDNDYFDELSDKELRDQFVLPWRRANPRIVRLWQQLGDAFGDTGKAGPILSVEEFHDQLGRGVKLNLPSGRAIYYHGTRWERYKVVDPRTGRLVSKEGWRYADPKNPFNHRQRIGTYGGRLAENATQAVARDIMAQALVRLRAAGYEPVAHVHDEILVEGEHDVAEISRIMTEVPDWAYGMPIDGEGFTCKRYRKG